VRAGFTLLAQLSKRLRETFATDVSCLLRTNIRKRKKKSLWISTVRIGLTRRLRQLCNKTALPVEIRGDGEKAQNVGEVVLFRMRLKYGCQQSEALALVHKKTCALTTDIFLSTTLISKRYLEKRYNSRSPRCRINKQRLSVRVIVRCGWTCWFRTVESLAFTI
jgi:hypothetical protein